MAIQHYSARPSGIERYHTVTELHEMTGIPRKSIYRAVERGELRVTRLNGTSRCYFAESEVRRWLAECTS